MSPLPVLSLYADDTSIISTSDASTIAIFQTYELFEKGTGSKLNLKKCEGLWIGAWRNRLDAPVPIIWSSVKMKVLGVFIGNVPLDEANWRPRIEAVQKCLDSWRSRALSLSGKALVCNALALSRVWYVASLVHMPSWVLSELNSIVFKFFWSGKRDLVARKVVVQPRENGGFNVVSIRCKVDALLIQWVRRLSTSPNTWVSLLTFWFFDRFGVGPLQVFSRPVSITPDLLPPFYAGLLRAWTALGGFMSPSGLTVSSGPSLVSVSSVSCKLCYQLSLTLNLCQPHCVTRFQPVFGALDWPCTWKSIFFMPLDRLVSDLNWKVAHGVLYTADRLISFGYAFSGTCFCGYHLESAKHLFFSCPLAQSGIAFIQSLLFLAAPLAPPIDVRHMFFGFNSDELRCVPRVFSYLLNVCKFFIWFQRNDMRFRSIRPSAVKLLAALRSRASLYLPLFAKRFQSSRRYFVRQWGANGYVGSICGDKFTVSF